MNPTSTHAAVIGCGLVQKEAADDWLLESSFGSPRMLTSSTDSVINEAITPVISTSGGDRPA